LLAEVINSLICPHCGGSLRQNGASLICSGGHTSNVARQGYVSLLGRHSGTHTADSAEMISARERVLGAGLFDPVAEAIEAAVADSRLAGIEGIVLDLGSGPGYYLKRALEAAPTRFGIAVDNSKYAARRAARCHPRAGAVVADIWEEVPLRSGSSAVVLNVFAPRNGEEILRILAPGGHLVAVTPGPGHLKELIEPFSMISVDSEKEERLRGTLGPLAEGMEAQSVDWTLALSRTEVADLVAMGPSAGRLEAEELETALDRLEYPFPATGSVAVSTASRPASPGPAASPGPGLP
jgi:23S rRNA (guanine745-N1)-methyltransferase